MKISGKQSTRDQILTAIRTVPEATVDALAQVANISPVTARHHLNALQADGLIEAQSVRRKVGRPYYVYNLSQKGQEQFPTRYVQLTSRLLEELKAHLPTEVVETVFSGVVESIIADHPTEFETLDFEQKLDYLVDLLKHEGFLAEWEATENGYKITEYSCPYISVGNQHSEVCHVDKQLILTVLQTPVEQHSCMLDGADCCEFSVIRQTNN